MPSLLDAVHVSLSERLEFPWVVRRASGETQVSVSIAVVFSHRPGCCPGSGRLDTSFKQDLSYGPKIQGNDDPVRIFRETSFRDISLWHLHLWLCVCLLMVKGGWGACYRVGMFHCNCVYGRTYNSYFPLCSRPRMRCVRKQMRRAT